MKLFVLFLLTGLLPILCFGLKCWSCTSPFFANQLCEKTEEESCTADKRGCSKRYGRTQEGSFIIKECTILPQGYKKDQACKKSENDTSRETLCFCIEDLCNIGENEPFRKGGSSSLAKPLSLSLVGWLITGFIYHSLLIQ